MSNTVFDLSSTLFVLGIIYFSFEHLFFWCRSTALRHNTSQNHYTTPHSTQTHHCSTLHTTTTAHRTSHALHITTPHIPHTQHYCSLHTALAAVTDPCFMPGRSASSRCKKHCTSASVRHSPSYRASLYGSLYFFPIYVTRVNCLDN